MNDSTSNPLARAILAERKLVKTALDRLVEEDLRNIDATVEESQRRVQIATQRRREVVAKIEKCQADLEKLDEGYTRITGDAVPYDA